MKRSIKIGPNFSLFPADHLSKRIDSSRLWLLSIIKHQTELQKSNVLYSPLYFQTRHNPKIYQMIKDLQNVCFYYFSEKHRNKFFIIDISISVNISFCNEFISFLFWQDISNILHDKWQLCGRYKTIALLVKYSKCLSNLLLYLRIMKFSIDNRKKINKKINSKLPTESLARQIH